MDGKALTEQVRPTYDAVAEVYAARFVRRPVTKLDDQAFLLEQKFVS